MFLASNYYIWLSMKRIEGVEKVRMTILAPIAMVALPLVMTKVMTDYPVPDPMSLAFLLPLILAPFTLARFIPAGPVHPLVAGSFRRLFLRGPSLNRLLDGRRGRCHLAHPPRIRSDRRQVGGGVGAAGRIGTSWL